MIGSQQPFHRRSKTCIPALQDARFPHFRHSPLDVAVKKLSRISAALAIAFTAISPEQSVGGSGVSARADRRLSCAEFWRDER